MKGLDDGGFASVFEERPSNPSSAVRLSPAGHIWSVLEEAKGTQLPLFRQSAAFDLHFTAENRRLKINWVTGGGLN